MLLKSNSRVAAAAAGHVRPRPAMLVVCQAQQHHGPQAEVTKRLALLALPTAAALLISTAKPAKATIVSSGKAPQTVAAAYAAYARGDVPAFLDLYADDIKWHSNWTGYKQPQGYSKQELPNMFAEIAGLQLTKFNVKRIMGDDGSAVAIIEVAGTDPRSGRPYDVDMVHVWELNEAGKFGRFSEYVDNADF